MKRAGLFLTMLVLASLLLAACGAQETPTSVPNTSAPLATNTSEMTATEAATTAPTSTSEANMTSTPVIPVTGGNGPSQRITSLMGSSICGMAGDQLGTVQDMVLDFNQGLVTYMIVDANGKSVAVPYSFIIEPRTSGPGTGSGNGTSGTGSSGTGALSTSTPSTGGALSTATSTTGTGSSSGSGTLSTSTPSAGGAVSTATSTTGTGTGPGTGTEGSAQQNCLTLTLDNDLFKNAPAFDKSIMPGKGQSAQEWDATLMDYWVSGGQPAATSTPDASGAAGATPTATMAPGAQPIQGVFLASDLLNASIVLNSPGAGSGSSSGTGTGSSLSTSTPSAGGSSSTAVPESTATASSGGAGTGSGSSTGTGSAMGSTSTDNSQGTIQDVVIDARIGKLQYLVVSFATDTWILVPVSLVGWDATNNQFALMTSASMLQNAPSFSSSQFPDTSTSGWSEQFSSYWSGGGSGSGTGSGASTTATATP